MIDLKVCISCYNSNRLSPETINSLKLLKGSKYSYEIFMKESNNVEYVKNDLTNDMLGDHTQQVIQDDFVYRLFIEDGVKFVLDDIDRLMSYNLPVIAAVKVNRMAPNILDCGFFEIDGDNSITRVTFFDAVRETKTVHQIDWVNSPLMLVKSEVFSLITYPWFVQSKISIVSDDDVVHVKYISENMGFCKKLVEAGVPVFADINTMVEVC